MAQIDDLCLRSYVQVRGTKNAPSYFGGEQNLAHLKKTSKMSEGAASVPPSLDKAKLYYLNLVTDIDVTPIIEVCKAIGAEEVKFESLPKGTYNLVLIAHGDKKGKSL